VLQIINFKLHSHCKGVDIWVLSYIRVNTVFPYINKIHTEMTTFQDQAYLIFMDVTDN